MYAQRSYATSIAIAPNSLCARTGLMIARTGMAPGMVDGSLPSTRACFHPTFRGFIEAANNILEAGEVRHVALVRFSLLSSMLYTSSLKRNIFTVLW